MLWLIIKDCCKSKVNNETSWKAGRSRELCQPVMYSERG